MEQTEFQKWFGRSKMIDADGLAQRMYHITATEFDELRPGGRDNTLSGPAIWITPDKLLQPAGHNTVSNGEFREGTHVLPVFVQMKNPLYITCHDEMSWAQQRFDLNSGFPRCISQEVVDQIRADGYDGVYATYYNYASGYDLESGRGVEVLAFDSAQVIGAFSEVALTRLQSTKEQIDSNDAVGFPLVGNLSKNQIVDVDRAIKALRVVDESVATSYNDNVRNFSRG